MRGRQCGEDGNCLRLPDPHGAERLTCQAVPQSRMVPRPGTTERLEPRGNHLPLQGWPYGHQSSSRRWIPAHLRIRARYGRDHVFKQFHPHHHRSRRRLRGRSVGQFRERQPDVPDYQLSIRWTDRQRASLPIHRPRRISAFHDTRTLGPYLFFFARACTLYRLYAFDEQQPNETSLWRQPLILLQRGQRAKSAQASHRAAKTLTTKRKRGLVRAS